MVRTNAALVAEVHQHSIPRNLRAQRGIISQERVQSFGSGAAGECDAERAFFGNGGSSSLHKLLGRAFGDSLKISQDAYVVLHDFSRRSALAISCRGCASACLRRQARPSEGKPSLPAKPVASS